jgi:hypothetical protein
MATAGTTNTREGIMRRINGTCGAMLVALGLCAGSASASVTLHLTASRMTAVAGDTIVVQAVVDPGGTAFNAFALVVRYDPALVTFVPASPSSQQIGPLMTGACGSQFHVFTPAPDSLEGDVSLLCGGVKVTGPGTLYQLRFVAKSANGIAVFTPGVSTTFYDAGVVVGPLTAGGTSVGVGSTAGVGPDAARAGALEAPRPNPCRADGGVVAFALASPAHVRLALLDVQGRAVATRDLGSLAAGRTSVRWSPAGLAPGHYELRLSADGAIVGRRAWVVLR